MRRGVNNCRKRQNETETETATLECLRVVRVTAARRNRINNLLFDMPNVFQEYDGKKRKTFYAFESKQREKRREQEREQYKT